MRRHVAALLLLVLCLGRAAGAAAETGYVVLDVDSGRELAAAEADRPFIPASVAKLPTALTVLNRLGGDHRYRTRLLGHGTIEDGVLHGDLILAGGGDPLLDHPALQDMAAALKARGVRRVAGRFLYDASALPHIPVLNPRQPPDASYNPGIDGLSLDHNRFLVDWRGGRPSGAEMPLDPPPVSLPAAHTGRAWLPVRDPGAFAARAFAWAAAEIGIVLPPPEPGRAGAGALPLVVHDSPLLRDILRAVLIYSNNVAMEILALGATGAATPEDAGNAVIAAMERSIPGLSTTGLVLPNTSGLDDRARMTPRQCALIARQAARRADVRPLLPPLLTDPFATHDRRQPSPSPLRAKTGTLAYARALAGVIATRSGRDLAFCVMTDDRAARAAYAALPFAQRAKEQPDARAWHRMAVATEAALVLGWRDRF
jgi:D-alanyl-D-alanine carboxypeptidase/D-alanyl-D-alanine-endopeptidase (penicillin-binding protein 4)